MLCQASLARRPWGFYGEGYLFFLRLPNFLPPPGADVPSRLPAVPERLGSPHRPTTHVSCGIFFLVSQRIVFPVTSGCFWQRPSGSSSAARVVNDVLLFPRSKKVDWSAEEHPLGDLPVAVFKRRCDYMRQKVTTSLSSIRLLAPVGVDDCSTLFGAKFFFRGSLRCVEPIRARQLRRIFVSKSSPRAPLPSGPCREDSALIPLPL